MYIGIIYKINVVNLFLKILIRLFCNDEMYWIEKLLNVKEFIIFYWEDFLYC